MFSLSTILQKVQQQWLYLNIKIWGRWGNFYPQSFKELYDYEKASNNGQMKGAFITCRGALCQLSSWQNKLD